MSHAPWRPRVVERDCRVPARLAQALLQAGALTVLLNTMLTNSLHANLLALCCKTLAVLCRHSEAARVQAVKLEVLPPAFVGEWRVVKGVCGTANPEKKFCYFFHFPTL